MRLNAPPLVLALSVLTVSPIAVAQTPQPLTELIAAFPYGEHRCLTVTPDETRAFVGRGAVISVLDVTTFPPSLDMQAVQEVEVPDVGPQALAYFRHPATPQPHWLFLAGGTLGLWRISLCDNLFLASPIACADSTFQPTRIDRPGSDSTWQWKRCVDVAIVEGNAAAGQPLLFALYAANSDPLKSSVGPTELRCYKLEPDGTTSLFLSVDLPSDGPVGEDAVGTALESDPQDPNNVYVALGTAWLWKVTIQASPTLALVPSQVPTPPSIALCSLAPCPAGEAMTDIDLVRVPAVGPVVYAALEYRRVLEYRLTSGVVKEVTLMCDRPLPSADVPSYLERVAAVTASDNSVLIAVATQDGASRYVQTTAPFMPDGLWSDICISTGVANANVGTASDPDHCREIQFLWSRPTTTVGPQALGVEPETYDRLWGSLVLTHQSGLDFRLYACSERSATSVFGIFDEPCGSMGPIDPIPCLGVDLLARWRGIAFAAADGAMSILNPGLTFHGKDGFGPYDGTGELQILPVGSGVDFFPVANASTSCPGTVPPPAQTCGAPPTDFKIGNKNPFGGSVAGSATWRDPLDADLEWFMPGGLVGRPMRDCVNVDLCSELADPCAGTPVRWNLDGGMSPVGILPDVGWDVVRLRPNNPAGPPADGLFMELKWWQLLSPSLTPNDRSETVPYVFSAADPRLVDTDPSSADDYWIPEFLHLLRGGSKSGYKVMDPADLMARAHTTCSQTGLRGRGEDLAPGSGPAFAEALTHVEFEEPGSQQPTCTIIAACAGADGAPGFRRNLHNNKAHIFPVRDLEGEEVWIAAVAAGFIASGPSQAGFTQSASCQWVNDYGRALITFYDLTNVDPQVGGGNSPPHLIRVALGPSGVQSHAFAIRTKSTGTGPNSIVWAYVADLTGRLLTYKLKWSELFNSPPAQGEPYRPFNGVHHPYLQPSSVIQFPINPYDGLRPNCVDIEIDGNDAYCALGRAGIGIVDLSMPDAPMLHTILDTPGFTLGIVFRPDGLNDVQMVVGDSRAGMRLYGRPQGGGLGGDGSAGAGQGGGE